MSSVASQFVTSGLLGLFPSSQRSRSTSRSSVLEARNSSSLTPVRIELQDYQSSRMVFQRHSERAKLSSVSRIDLEHAEFTQGSTGLQRSSLSISNTGRPLTFGPWDVSFSTLCLLFRRNQDICSEASNASLFPHLEIAMTKSQTINWSKFLRGSQTWTAKLTSATPTTRTPLTTSARTWITATRKKNRWDQSWPVATPN